MYTIDIRDDNDDNDDHTPLKFFQGKPSPRYHHQRNLNYFLIFCQVDLFCGLFCCSLYLFVTMDDNNSPPNMKSKRQVQHFIKLKFLILYNGIELTYDSNKGRGYKTKGHTQRQFSKPYIILCVKTLNCQYFKDLFINVPLNKDLDVLE